jgi:hypothetical protein
MARLPDCRLRRREFADLDRQGHKGPDGLTAFRAASSFAAREASVALVEPERDRRRATGSLTLARLRRPLEPTEDTFSAPYGRPR